MDNKLKWRKELYFSGSHKSYLKFIYATYIRIKLANLFKLNKTLVIRKKVKVIWRRRLKYISFCNLPIDKSTKNLQSILENEQKAFSLRRTKKRP